MKRMSSRSRSSTSYSSLMIQRSSYSNYVSSSLKFLPRKTLRERCPPASCLRFNSLWRYTFQASNHHLCLRHLLLCNLFFDFQYYLEDAPWEGSIRVMVLVILAPLSLKIHSTKSLLSSVRASSSCLSRMFSCLSPSYRLLRAIGETGRVSLLEGRKDENPQTKGRSFRGLDLGILPHRLTDTIHMRSWRSKTFERRYDSTFEEREHIEQLGAAIKGIGYLIGTQDLSTRSASSVRGLHYTWLVPRTRAFSNGVDVSDSGRVDPLEEGHRPRRCREACRYCTQRSRPSGRVGGITGGIRALGDRGLRLFESSKEEQLGAAIKISLDLSTRSASSVRGLHCTWLVPRTRASSNGVDVTDSGE
ncbi:hypothetical protein M9H77_25949 [Catharanthus roseus]|uniref:Uncharacterized protein n=1 Tax=Catharanthus roseus TaxID=4058 RepID=A0ACC0A994_CATRO|nr:hypothetical protein M9H77_25949 [Catharanthus roseus]